MPPRIDSGDPADALDAGGTSPDARWACSLEGSSWTALDFPLSRSPKSSFWASDGIVATGSAISLRCTAASSKIGGIELVSGVVVGIEVSATTGEVAIIMFCSMSRSRGTAAPRDPVPGELPAEEIEWRRGRW